MLGYKPISRIKGEKKMTLVRVLSRVDEKGKTNFPNNVRLEVGLKPGQLVELKIIGASSRKRILVSPKR